MAGFKMDDYVDVAERIREFYERYPEGSLQSGSRPYIEEIGGRPFVVYHALAYRHPEDDLPAHGWAWEPVPGPTQFTKDSELMNAETAAWGRAIVAAGFSTKKIASAQEVRNRQQPAASPSAAGGTPKAPAPSSPGAAGAPLPTETQMVEYGKLLDAWKKLSPVFDKDQAVALALDKDGPWVIRATRRLQENIDREIEARKKAA